MQELRWTSSGMPLRAASGPDKSTQRHDKTANCRQIAGRSPRRAELAAENENETSDQKPANRTHDKKWLARMRPQVGDLAIGNLRQSVASQKQGQRQWIEHTGRQSNSIVIQN